MPRPTGLTSRTFAEVTGGLTVARLLLSGAPVDLSPGLGDTAPFLGEAYAAGVGREINPAVLDGQLQGVDVLGRVHDQVECPPLRLPVGRIREPVQHAQSRNFELGRAAHGRDDTG